VHVKNPPFTNQAYHKQHVQRLSEQLNSLAAHTRPPLLEGCRRVYEEAVASRPSDRMLRLRYGRFLDRALSDKAAALGQFRATVSLVPDYVGCCDLALALRRAGLTNEAINNLNMALDDNPVFLTAYLYLGAIHAMNRDHESAARCFSQAIRIDPRRSQRAYADLATALLASGRARKAVDTLRRGIRVFTESAALRYECGRILQRQGKTDEAAELFLEALFIDPQHEPSRQALAARRLR
jgi:tetratricopeptide (TPR) repeat protein